MALPHPSTPSHRSRPLRAAALAALALLAAMVLLLATSSRSPARAVLGIDATCTSSGTMSFAPGLRLSPSRQTFSGTGTYFPCVSTKVLKGTWAGKGSGILSCTGGSADMTIEVDWTRLNGQAAHSTIEVEATVVGGDGGAALVTEGMVASGLFAGDTYSAVFDAVGLDVLDCLNEDGVQNAIGVGTAIFSKP